MPRFAYDLHIHSCLSPCGDEEMTPPNIVNMAVIKGLDIIAITDHNSALNARAVIKAAAGGPLTVIPGIEVTTAEEIHVVCLFPDADSAEEAGRALQARMPRVINRPELFGRQLIMDEHEAIKGQFETLLISALDLSIDTLPEFVAKCGGVCFPAHIDRQANSILSVFGVLPEAPAFQTLEVHNPERFFASTENEKYRREHRIVTSSDAHRLEDISEREHFLELESPTFAALRKALLAEKT